MTDHHGDHDVLWWSTDTPATIATAVISCLAIIFTIAVSRRTGRHGIWRAGAFLLAAILGTCALFSGIAVYAHLLPVHVCQHLVLMMVVAPLLVAAGPLQLLMQALSDATRSAVNEVLSDPAVRRFTAGKRTALWLSVDYYGSMAVYLLTPIYAWSHQYPWIHYASHIYFLLCGIAFWVPLVGGSVHFPRFDPATERTVLLAGVPFYIALGLAVAVLPITADRPGALAAGVLLSLGGSILSLGAWSVIGARTPRHEDRFLLAETGRN